MECTRKLILLIGLTLSLSAHSNDVKDCLSIEDSECTTGLLRSDAWIHRSISASIHKRWNVSFSRCWSASSHTRKTCRTDWHQSRLRRAHMIKLLLTPYPCK